MHKGPLLCYRGTQGMLTLVPIFSLDLWAQLRARWSAIVSGCLFFTRSGGSKVPICTAESLVRGRLDLRHRPCLEKRVSQHLPTLRRRQQNWVIQSNKKECEELKTSEKTKGLMLQHAKPKPRG